MSEGDSTSNGTEIIKRYLDSKELNFILSICIPSVLSVIGLAGNILSYTVFNRYSHQPKTSTYLLKILALIDSLVLISHSLFYGLFFLKQHSDVYDGFVYKYAFLHVYRFVRFAHYTFLTQSIWLTVVVTVDRYIAVCYPLKNYLRTIPIFRKYITVLSVGAVLFNVPHYFEYVIKPAGLQENEWTFTRQAFYNSQDGSSLRIQYLIYNVLLHMLLFSLGHLLILSVLNIRLLRSIHGSLRHRQHITHNCSHTTTADQKNFTTMLVTVISVVIVCVLPYPVVSIFYLLNYFLKFDVSMVLEFMWLVKIGNVTMIINSTVNFFLYCIFWKKFRKILRHVIDY